MRQLLRAHGARLEIVDRPGAHRAAGRRRGWTGCTTCSPSCPDAYWPDQYNNPDNTAGYASLAAELAAQLDHLDILVCSVGTGGHSAGIAGPLRRHWPGLRLIGVDADRLHHLRPARRAPADARARQQHPPAQRRLRRLRRGPLDRPGRGRGRLPPARPGQLRQRRLEHRRRRPGRRLGGPSPPRARSSPPSSPTARTATSARSSTTTSPPPTASTPATAATRPVEIPHPRAAEATGWVRCARVTDPLRRPHWKGAVKVSLRTVRLELTEPLRISRSTMAARDAVRLDRRTRRAAAATARSSPASSTASTPPTLATASRPGRRSSSRFADPEDRPGGPAGRRAGERRSTPAAVTAAVEAALLDLVGKRAAVPVHRLLGRPPRPRAGHRPHHRHHLAGTRGRQARRLAASGFSGHQGQGGRPRTRRTTWTAYAPSAPPRPAPGCCSTPTVPGRPRRRGRCCPGSPDSASRPWNSPSRPATRRRWRGSGRTLARCRSSPTRTPSPARTCGGSPARGRRQRQARQVRRRARGPAYRRAIEGSGTDLMLGCLIASTLGIAPAVHLADRARWIDLDGHLLLAHDPWTGIGGEDGIVRASGLPGSAYGPAPRPGPEGGL